VSLETLSEAMSQLARLGQSLVVLLDFSEHGVSLETLSEAAMGQLARIS
jgi:hypothetical protein